MHSLGELLRTCSAAKKRELRAALHLIQRDRRDEEVMGRGRAGICRADSCVWVYMYMCFSWAIFELDLNVSLLPKIHWKSSLCEKAHGYAKLISPLDNDLTV